MSENSILEIRNVWKEYSIGEDFNSYHTVRDAIRGVFTKKKDIHSNKNKFWALKDISFNVAPGNSVGIIGRNGAGKSTMLKILSKITSPTLGEIICRGRVASLLEVGTGFHPELTGRENIFLNGSILGLRKSEIKLKLEEIVEFSGIKKFLDTPLKRYSSGMQLRLAFSVAAHLEPEILIIDEVLAVGDNIFQKKCIDKMSEIGKSGRTILFVSHNLSAVRSLCNKVVVLEDGEKTFEGNVNDGINYYQSDQKLSGKTINLQEVKRIKNTKCDIIFQKVDFLKSNFDFGEQLTFSIKLQSNVRKHFKELQIAVGITDLNNNTVIHVSNQFLNRPFTHYQDSHLYEYKIQNQLKPGVYRLTFFLTADNEIQDWLNEVIDLEIADGNPYNYNNTSIIQGAILPEFDVIQK